MQLPSDKIYLHQMKVNCNGQFHTEFKSFTAYIKVIAGPHTHIVTTKLSFLSIYIYTFPVKY